jgi:hypothetical protein
MRHLVEPSSSLICYAAVSPMTSSLTAPPSTVHFFAKAMVTTAPPTAGNTTVLNPDTPTAASYQTPASPFITAYSTTSNVTTAATAPDEPTTIQVCTSLILLIVPSPLA